MKEIIELLYQSFALTSIIPIFKNDAHEIVSRKGWEVLNDPEQYRIVMRDQNI